MTEAQPSLSPSSPPSEPPPRMPSSAEVSIHAGMTQRELNALWEVHDAAKMYVQLQHRLATTGRHRAEARRGYRALTDAVSAEQALAWSSESVPSPPASLDGKDSFGATLEQRAALTWVAASAESYVRAVAKHDRKKEKETASARDAALILLCRELDRATFYRIGPQLRESPDVDVPVVGDLP